MGVRSEIGALGPSQAENDRSRNPLTGKTQVGPTIGRMGDSGITGYRARILERGRVDVRNPLVAVGRFWAQGWRFHGRASRSEFWWVLAVEAVVVAALFVVVQQTGMAGRWGLYADPFGVVLSPQVGFHLFEVSGHSGFDRAWFGFGSGRDTWPDGWDIAVIVGLVVTALPRWSLLVRRLHDRDHTGAWIVLLVLTGPIGWLVVTGMVASRSRPRGARFDRGLLDGRRDSDEPAGAPGPAVVVPER